MKIRIPASSANLGPGFDTLGLALEVYNEVNISHSSYQSISVKGEGEQVKKLKTNNVFVSIFLDIYQELTNTKGVFRFEFENNIPFSRGMGSSSAVIVGAIAAAYEMAQVKTTKQNVLNRALVYENHPDNIAPAAYGGFTASVVHEGEVQTLKKSLPKEIKAVMVIPDRPMSTAQSRTQLPKSYRTKDVIFNTSRVGLMCSAVFSQEWEMLRYCGYDRMHEYKRMKKLKELFEVRKIALENGAIMSTLSGSGSSFFNLVYQDDASRVQNVLKNHFHNFQILQVDFDNEGYSVIES